MNILYNKEQIKEIIPHRYPFLLIDEIVKMQGNSIIGVKHVQESEYYFAGHFPEKKVMPGVLQVEALAQTGAVAILKRPEFAGKIAFLGTIKEAKFRHPVIPGDHLRLEVILQKLGSRAGVASAAAYICNQKEDLYSQSTKDQNGKPFGTLACECQITFVIG